MSSDCCLRPGRRTRVRVRRELSALGCESSSYVSCREGITLEQAGHGSSPAYKLHTTRTYTYSRCLQPTTISEILQPLSVC